MKDKIKKYLLKQKEITLKTESSTGSVYFKLNDIIVRLSDHINPSYNEPDKLNIVISADGEGCVIILGNRIMQFDKYEKVREWLKFYIKSSYCLKLIPKIVNKTVEVPIAVDSKYSEIVSLLDSIHPDYYESIIKTIEELSKSNKSVYFKSGGNKYSRNGEVLDLTGLTLVQKRSILGMNGSNNKLKERINKYKAQNKL